MRLKNCRSCLVYGFDERPLSRARVEQVSDQKFTLYFTRPDLRSARLRSVVDLYDSGKGLVRCLFEIVLSRNTNPDIPEPWVGDAKLLRVYDIIQRQKDSRIKVSMIETFTAPNGYEFTGSIQNLSAGGLFMSSEQEMNVGQLLSVTLKLNETELRMDIKVVRKQPLNSNGYGYGCQFVDISDDDSSVIRQYVYNLQIDKEIKRNARNRVEANE